MYLFIRVVFIFTTGRGVKKRGVQSQFSINHSLRDDFVSDPSQTLPGRLTCLIKNGMADRLRPVVQFKNSADPKTPQASPQYC